MYKQGICALLAAVLMACGGDGVSYKTEQSLNLAVSDAPVDGANKVVITVDEVEFRSDGADSVIINDFVDENGDPVSQVQFDLLEYQGANSLSIIAGQEVTIGSYNQLILRGPFSDIAQSYVEEEDAEIKPIKVPSNELKLGAISIAANSQPLSYTIEFELSKSMNYKPGPDEYTLKPRGVRIVEDGEVSIVQGWVDQDLFWDAAGGACDLAADDAHYRRIYLYEYPQASGEDDTGLSNLALADLFDPNETTVQPDPSLLEPYAVAPLQYNDETEQWDYQFGYVPAGSYIVAYMCDGSLDDSEQYQSELAVPSVVGYQQAFSVETGVIVNCNFSGASGEVSCN